MGTGLSLGRSLSTATGYQAEVQEKGLEEEVEGEGEGAPSTTPTFALSDDEDEEDDDVGAFVAAVSEALLGEARARSTPGVFPLVCCFRDEEVRALGEAPRRAEAARRGIDRRADGAASIDVDVDVERRPARRRGGSTDAAARPDESMVQRFTRSSLSRVA